MAPSGSAASQPDFVLDTAGILSVAVELGAGPLNPCSNCQDVVGVVGQEGDRKSYPANWNVKAVVEVQRVGSTGK